MKNFRLTALILAVVASLTIAAGSQAKSKADFTGIVNVNTATLPELMQLPGIGQSKAQAIIDRRTQAPFKEVAELKDVKGIGDALLAKLSPHVTVSGAGSAGSAPLAPRPMGTASTGAAAKVGP